ncbi:MAG: hypothetical protein AB1779_02000 [Candidatus Thermoplasmatota archaeon]
MRVVLETETIIGKESYSVFVLENLEPGVILLIAIALLILGLLLAFFGRKILKFIIGIVGAVICGLLGWTFGYVLSGSWLIATVSGLIGSVIGSYVFNSFVELGLSLSIGLCFFLMLLPYTLFWLSAIIAGIVFVICYVYIEEIISFVTAAAGSAFFFLGTLLLNKEYFIIALIVGVILFITGSIMQIKFLGGRKKDV